MKSSIFKLFALLSFIGPITAHAAIMKSAIERAPGSTTCAERAKNITALRKEFINPKIENLPTRRASTLKE